jgi:AraC family transcriptional regulator
MAHLDEPLDVATLAAMCGRSQYHFSRVFSRSVGVSPYRYVMHLRLKHAFDLIRKGALPLAQVAYSVGFADQSHLTRWVRRAYGVTPTAISSN